MGCCLSSNPASLPDSTLNPSSLPPLDQEKSRVIIKSEQFIHQSEGKLESSYDLERVLGSGAYGRVYEGRHKATGAKRAVKVIERYRLPESQVNQMLSEVFLLKSLVRSS
jgi:serine/threonine protein kinase